MSAVIPDKAGESAGASQADSRLKIAEIFLSLQGEARDAGWPTVFVRLTGCPLRCHYCDTAYAFYGGQWQSINDIMTTVQGHAVRHVCVTGGEPLAQKGCQQLLVRLCDAGYIVSLETSGALSIAEVDQRVSRVLDIKTPGSGEQDKNLWENLAHLTGNDQIKFVICNRQDFDWAADCVKTRKLQDYCDVLFSPSKDQLDPAALAEWILADSLPVRFQMQLHKILWGDAPGK